MLRARSQLAGWAAALALFGSPGLASAAVPTGSFDFILGGNQSIWFGEIGDDDAFCEVFAAGLEEIEYCNFEMFVDGKGRLSGYLEFAAWSDGILISLHGPLKGAKRGDGQTGFMRSAFSLKLVGEASDGDSSLGVKASIQYAGQVAPGGVASAFWEQRFCVEGGGCESYQTDSPTETLSNGNWLVELTIADVGGGALTGDARVEFGDGSECFYDIDGKFSAKADLASFALTPITPACAGTSIQMRDVRVVEPLPTLPSSNQEVFDFTCSGALTIAASVDPGTCAWSISGSEQAPSASNEPPLSVGQMKYKLFGFAGEGYVYSYGNSPSSSSFGRVDFLWVPKNSTIFTVVSNPPRRPALFEPIAP